MGYLPHVVKATSGSQPGVVSKAYLVSKTGDPGGQQRLLYVDVMLLGNVSTRAKLRRLRFVGTLTANSSADTAADINKSVSAKGGFYDEIYDFLGSSVGGTQSVAERTSTMLKLLEGQTVLVQNLGGRLVVT